MNRSSRLITLVLIGTGTALAGYQVIEREGGDGGADFDNGITVASTRPYSHSHSYYPSTYGSSFYSGSGRGSSGARSGTSRGGFGGSGHAAGS